MTRINVGIEPEYLCDQHLVAEYRELPRLWFKESKSKPPENFKLGAGHCLWCQQYQGMLYDRFTGIVKEMKYRGFNVSYPEAPAKAKDGKRPPQSQLDLAKPILIERINERLSTMNKPPRWTKRDNKIFMPA